MPPDNERPKSQTNQNLKSLSPYRTQDTEIPAVQQALQGDLSEKPMSYLLKAAAHYEATGHLHVGSESFGVTVQFGLGKVVHAVSAFQKGEEAIVDLFTWADGRLTFENGRQPDKVTVLEPNETLISRGESFVADSSFLREHNISETSFLTRAAKLSAEELTSMTTLVPFYKPELLSEFYGNIYGTLNLKDAAARMNLSHSKWVSITALLLRLGLLLSPEGKSLKSIDTSSLLGPSSVPMPKRSNDTKSITLTGLSPMPPAQGTAATGSPDTGSTSVPLPKRAESASITLTNLATMGGQQGANEPVAISIKKSIADMGEELAGEKPPEPKPNEDKLFKVGVSADMSSYGPSDLASFWRVINAPSTLILNREMFLYMLSHEFARAHRFQEVLTLAVFAMSFENAKDDLVPIEDVCLIVRAVEKVKREVDLFGHFGDRSFALLLPRVDSARTCILVDRINERLPEMVPSLAPSKPKLHFGLATAPADAASLSLLVKTAHSNMQEAATKGLHRLQ